MIGMSGKDAAPAIAAIPPITPAVIPALFAVTILPPVPVESAAAPTFNAADNAVEPIIKEADLAEVGTAPEILWLVSDVIGTCAVKTVGNVEYSNFREFGNIAP